VTNPTRAKHPRSLISCICFWNLLKYYEGISHPFAGSQGASNFQFLFMDLRMYMSLPHEASCPVANLVCAPCIKISGLFEDCFLDCLAPPVLEDDIQIKNDWNLGEPPGYSLTQSQELLGSRTRRLCRKEAWSPERTGFD